MNRPFTPISLLVLALSAGCCAPYTLEPATGLGAVVSVEPGAAGLVEARSWKNGNLQPNADADACPKHKEAFEKALGLNPAEACPIVREAVAPASGDGDAEVPVPIAPHCYDAGAVLIVVRYQQPKTTCSRIVGIAVLPKKKGG